MGTRCTIHIEQGDNTTKIYYHHYDGYMSGVGEALWGMGKRRRAGGNSEVRVMRALRERFGREYKLVTYENDAEERVIGKSYLEYMSSNTDPLDIEWRYRIKLDGSLEVDRINTGETFKIANRRHFDSLVQHTEK